MAVSTLKAGDMSLHHEQGSHNRRKLFELLGIESSRVASLTQVHSKKIVLAEDGDAVKHREGDGLITNNRNTILSVTVADCVPIFLYTPTGDCFGLVHSGWKGTGIAAGCVNQMEKRFDVKAEQLSAVIGPSIGPCCYNVDAPRAEQFAMMWGDESAILRGGTHYIDLRKANVRLLEQAGVQNILVAENCTCCDPIFGSYRRQGPDDCTKMVALIGYFK